MFRRNGNKDDDATAPDDGARVPPLKPFSARGTHAPAPRMPLAPGQIQKRGVEIPPAPRRTDGRIAPTDDAGRLHIARGVRLSGAITSCDKLIVDGHVEADMPNTRLLIISTDGCYAGCAQVEDADISGRFDGDLTVTGRLSLRSTGRISGTLQYGKIMIEAGGEISGETRALTGADGTLPAADAPKTDKAADAEEAAS